MVKIDISTHVAVKTIKTYGQMDSSTYAFVILGHNKVRSANILKFKNHFGF